MGTRAIWEVKSARVRDVNPITTDKSRWLRKNMIINVIFPLCASMRDGNSYLPYTPTMDVLTALILTIGCELLIVTIVLRLKIKYLSSR
jgi:hypothetical protein